MEKVSIASQTCGQSGYFELKVAFGDLGNCQLKCPFCFTLDQQPCTDLFSTLNNRVHQNIKIVRFTGGEPFLRQDQISGMLVQLEKIQENKPEHLDLIVIQTNAISIREELISPFLEINLPILFEVSFKGTNPREFSYLCFENPIDEKAAKSIMEKQIYGYLTISDCSRSTGNISIIARLGIFHSSVNQPTFKFVFPGTTDLMFSPENWHEDFRYILKDQCDIWGETFEEKMIVEKIKTPADGSPGMGKRYRTIIDRLKSKSLMVESKSSLPKNFGRYYFYKKGNEVYWRAAQKLKDT